MMIGDMRVSKADGSQKRDLQRDVLLAAGVTAEHLYEDLASGRRDNRPGFRPRPGRNAGRPFKMTAARPRLAQAAMGQPGTKVGELCAEPGISRQTLYRHVDPKDALRLDGERPLGHSTRRSSLIPNPARAGA